MKKPYLVTISVIILCCIGWSFSAIAAKYDPMVEKAQKQLTELGYNPGPVDGKMGKKTEDAIQKFQKDNELPVTGKLDKETISKLGLSDTEKIQATPTPESPKIQPTKEQPEEPGKKEQTTESEKKEPGNFMGKFSLEETSTSPEKHTTLTVFDLTQSETSLTGTLTLTWTYPNCCAFDVSVPITGKIVGNSATLQHPEGKGACLCEGASHGSSLGSRELSVELIDDGSILRVNYEMWGKTYPKNYPRQP